MTVEVQGVPDTDLVGHRALVPSPRQQQAGAAIVSGGTAVAAAGARPAQPHPQADEAGTTAAARRRSFGLAAYLRSFDLRGELTRGELLVVAIFFVTDFVEYMIGGTALLIVGSQRDLHLSSTALITILSTIGTGATLLSPLIGFYGDRLRRKPLLVGGAFAMGICTILSGSGGLAALFVFQLFGNLGASFAGPFSAIRYSVLADYIRPDARGRVFAVSNTGGRLGNLVGPFAGGVMADTIGWRAGFLVFGICMTLTACCYLFLREPSRGQSERLAAGMAAGAVAEVAAPPSFAESLRTAWSVRTLRRLYITFPVISLGGALLYGVNFVHLQHDFRVTASGLGTLGAIGGALQVLFGLAVGPLIDRFIKVSASQVMVLIGALTLATGVVFAAITLSPLLVLALPLLLVQFSLAGAVGAANATLPSLVAPPRIRAFSLSLMAVWGLPGSLVAGPIIGFLYIQYGMAGAMAVALPVFVAGAAMLWSGAPFIASDMRAARSAAVAEVESRRAESEGRRKVLVCRDVDVTYSGVQVLFNVDFDVEEGEIVALLGTNGAGKSTLLRAISGLTEASNGAIFFDGRDITHMPTPAIARAGVVMVLGGRAIFPTLTVQENLDAATWTTAGDPAFVHTQMQRVLDEFFPSLRQRLHERAGTLSGGEQQMLALGQAFLMKPRLLMIDELSLGLAPAVVEQLLGILRAIHAAGTTVILVEQSVNVALTVAERAVFMEKGEVRFVGPTADLLRRPDIMRSVFFSAAAESGTSLATTHQARRTETQTTVLEVRDVACRFGGVQALRGVGLTLRAGEIVGVIGPNGAGKTTLFDAISGFVPTVSGMVRIAGHDATALDADARARLGLSRSFQDARLFAALGVRETIMLAMERHGAVRSAALSALWLPPVRQSESRLRRRADSLIEMLGLQRWADWPVGELSTGTRRIVDVACMMAAEPEVLLLDEPSSGVAQAEVQQLAPVLQRLRSETGCALLVIEHDMSLISAVSDRLVAMELGSVVVEGRPADVLSDARVVASYLGTSEEVIARSGA